jgi:hypothetical protein
LFPSRLLVVSFVGTVFLPCIRYVQLVRPLAVIAPPNSWVVSTICLAVGSFWSTSHSVHQFASCFGPRRRVISPVSALAVSWYYVSEIISSISVRRNSSQPLIRLTCSKRNRSLLWLENFVCCLTALVQHPRFIASPSLFFLTLSRLAPSHLLFSPSYHPRSASFASLIF